MGLLDGNLLGGIDPTDPRIALAAGLLGGTGNFGANLGRGLLGAMQAAQQAPKTALEKLQLQQQQRAFEESQRARDILAGTVLPQQPQGPQPQQEPGQLGGSPSPIPGGPTQTPQTGFQSLPFQTQPPAPGRGLQAIQGPGGAAAVPAQANNSKFATFNFYNDLATKMEGAGLPDQAIQYRNMAEKFRPAIQEVKTMTQGGQRVQVAVYKDGSTEILPFTPDLEKAHFADTGGAITPLDPFTGKPVGQGMAKSMSPGEIASNQIARANLGIAQQKLGIEQFNADPSGMFGINPRPMTGPGGAPGTGVSGEDFLKTIPKPVADQVKALAEGRMAFPAGFALKSPYWQSMITMVSQYDPSFDAVNYNSRSKTRNAFTSGQPATQINAMNTVIGHLKSLSDAADALNNKGFTPYNAATNYVAAKFGDPRIQQFEATKKAVVDELTRVWRGNGGSEGDVKTWASAISAANSPQQLHGVIGQIGELLQSKINAMGEQYKQGMGTTSAPIQLITPQASQALAALEARAKGGQMPSLDEINAEIARRQSK